MIRTSQLRTVVVTVVLAVLAVTASVASPPTASARSTTAAAVPRAVDGAPLGNHELYLHDAGSGSYEVRQVNLSGSLGHTTEQARFSSTWQNVVPADLDGDGQDELVLHSTSTQAFRFYDVRADGSAGRQLRSGAFEDRWTSITASDVRGDGRDELFLYNSATGASRYVSVASTLTLPAFSSGPVTRGWDEIAAVDTDGDGGDELIFFDAGTGRWTTRDVRSDGGLTRMADATLSLAWTSISALDFDRDERDEIVLYDASSGAYRVSQVSSTGLVSEVTRSGTWRTGFTTVAGVDVDPGPQLAGIARQILDRVNAERRDAGLPAVSMRNAVLTEAARWSQVMADQGDMRHRPDLTVGMPSGWRSIGENVAVGYRSADAVMDGWMQSSGHRANILNGSFTQMGVGVARAADGTLYYTQVFARY